MSVLNHLVKRVVASCILWAPKEPKIGTEVMVVVLGAESAAQAKGHMYFNLYFKYITTMVDSVAMHKKALFRWADWSAHHSSDHGIVPKGAAVFIRDEQSLILGNGMFILCSI